MEAAATSSMPRPAPASALRLQVSSRVGFQVLGGYPASGIPRFLPMVQGGELSISLLPMSQLKLDPF